MLEASNSITRFLALSMVLLVTNVVSMAQSQAPLERRSVGSAPLGQKPPNGEHGESAPAYINGVIPLPLNSRAAWEDVGTPALRDFKWLGLVAQSPQEKSGPTPDYQAPMLHSIYFFPSQEREGWAPAGAVRV